MYRNSWQEAHQKFKPNKGDILLMDPTASHEVTPLLSGQRQVLVFFIATEVAWTTRPSMVGGLTSAFSVSFSSLAFAIIGPLAP